MKKLLEEERAKARLSDILESMREETLKYYHNFLIKHVDVSIPTVIITLCHRKLSNFKASIEAEWSGTI